jgi:hypothetical protein
MEEWHG